jgi:hypothetical protein
MCMLMNVVRYRVKTFYQNLITCVNLNSVSKEMCSGVLVVQHVSVSGANYNNDS